ncbi:TAP42-like protein [Dichotomocladium elegans]|nr:TAP42-like protein [Dichotomocladium elegans]
MTAPLDNLTLGELFSSGQALLTDLEETSLASIDPVYQAKVEDALRRLGRANDLVEQLAMFSANEIVDDINPHELRFLLIPGYLGDLTLRITDRSTSRRSILEKAKAYFNTYLSTCEDHQLMSKADLEVYKQQQQQSLCKAALPAAQQRQQKIEQYKREKAIQNRIRELRDQLDAAAAAGDDDVERDWVLALIDLQVMKALQQLRAIDQELVMVKEMESIEEDRRRMKSSGDNTAGRVRLDNNNGSSRANWGRDKPLLSRDGRPLQPFVITNKRQAIKDQVFRPGHALPTMTIEEYLQQEDERGNIIRGGGEPPAEKEEIDDNDHAAQDAETIRKREWDEFVEANPKGWVVLFNQATAETKDK